MWTAHAAAAAHRAGVERFVQVSGIGANAGSDLAVHSQPRRRRGSRKGYLPRGTIVIRPAVMFGPDDVFVTAILVAWHATVEAGGRRTSPPLRLAGEV